MRMPEGEEREQRIKNLCEKIIAENSSNLVKETDIQAQEAQKVSNKMNPKKPTTRHIKIKMQKVKDKENLKKSKKKKKSIQLPTKEFPLDCQLISQQKLCRLEGSGKKYRK